MRKKSLKKQRLNFPEVDKNGIPLKELIAAHQQFCDPRSLKDNLGDGFLFSTNPIFHNIRLELRQRGFKFTTKDFCDYFSYPLMCLDEVIAAKKIPYRANFIWLEKLEKKCPAQFKLADLKRGGLQFNYLFHESAHCIAHSVFFGKKKIASLPKNSQTLLRILLGEAFANTSECLASIFAEGEIGSYFLDANCHYRSSEKEALFLIRYAQKFGLEAVAKILMASFLYANFMYKTLGDAEKKLIHKLAEIDHSTNLEPLFQVGLSLCEQFRSDTTQLHLIKCGFNRELGKLLKYDPVKKIMSEKSLHAQFNELAQILTKG